MLSLPLGWFALKIGRAERQKRAVEAIGQNVRVSVVYDYEWAEPEKFRQTELYTYPGPPAPEWVMNLFGKDLLADVVDLHIRDSEQRLDLQHLKWLTEARRMTLYDTQITDADLEYLKRLSNLNRLQFRGTQVTDEGIKELRNALPNCEIYCLPPY